MSSESVLSTTGLLHALRQKLWPHKLASLNFKDDARSALWTSLTVLVAIVNLSLTRWGNINSVVAVRDSASHKSFQQLVHSPPEQEVLKPIFLVSHASSYSKADTRHFLCWSWKSKNNLWINLQFVNMFFGFKYMTILKHTTLLICGHKISISESRYLSMSYRICSIKFSKVMFEHADYQEHFTITLHSSFSFHCAQLFKLGSPLIDKQKIFQTWYMITL